MQRERNLLFRELRLLHGELPPSRAVSPVFSSSGVSNISGGGHAPGVSGMFSAELKEVCPGRIALYLASPSGS
ncbi:hypothetical protein ACI2SX_24770, partial [Ralstonia nicotianae]